MNYGRGHRSATSRQMGCIGHHDAPFPERGLDEAELFEIHFGKSLLQITQAAVYQFRRGAGSTPTRNRPLPEELSSVPGAPHRVRSPIRLRLRQSRKLEREYR